MKVLDQVMNILKASEKARNSDTELMLIYFYKSGMNLSPEQIELFRKLPSMETIRRTRQLIQMKGQFPPNPEVEKQRYKKFQKMREGGTPEEVLENKRVSVPLPWGE